MHLDSDSPTAMILVAALVGLALAAVLTGLMRRYALAAQLLDQPNDRSMHTVPTPRGGGLGLLPPLLAGWCLLAALAGGTPPTPINAEGLQPRG